VELELRRFSVTLSGVDSDLLWSIVVPCLPLSTEYCIYCTLGVGDYFIVSFCSLVMYVYTTVVHFPFSGFGGCIHILTMCIPMHAMLLTVFLAICATVPRVCL
jgi:hypothetical protein